MLHSAVGELVLIHLEFAENLLNLRHHLRDNQWITGELQIINMFGHYELELTIGIVKVAKLLIHCASNKTTLVLRDHLKLE